MVVNSDASAIKCVQLKECRTIQAAHGETVPLTKRTNRAGCVSHGDKVSTWHNMCKTLDLSAATGKATKQIKEENNALEGLIEDNSIQESP